MMLMKRRLTFLLFKVGALNFLGRVQVVLNVPFLPLSYFSPQFLLTVHLSLTAATEDGQVSKVHSNLKIVHDSNFLNQKLATSFRYMQVNGLTSLSQYPYKNMKQQACRKAGHRNVLPPQFIVKQIEVEFKGDEESLRKLLYRVGCSF